MWLPDDVVTDKDQTGRPAAGRKNPEPRSQLLRKPDYTPSGKSESPAFGLAEVRIDRSAPIELCEF
jgi:hypothetical protein